MRISLKVNVITEKQVLFIAGAEDKMKSRCRFKKKKRKKHPPQKKQKTKKDRVLLSVLNVLNKKQLKRNHMIESIKRNK